MPVRTDRKQLVVYVTLAEREQLQAAAKHEHQSVSSYLLHLGLKRASQIEKAARTESQE